MISKYKDNGISKLFLPLGLFFLFFVLATVVVLLEKPEMSWMADIEIGEPAPRDIYAPVSFVFPNEAETQKLKDSLAMEAPEVLSVNPKTTDEGLQAIRAFFGELKTARSSAIKNYKEISQKYNLKEPDLEMVAAIENLDAAEDRIEKSAADSLKSGVVADSEKVSRAEKGKRNVIVYGTDGKELTVTPAQLVSETEAETNTIKSIQSETNWEKPIQTVFATLIQKAIRPNTASDEVQTSLHRKKLIDETPPIMDLVKKNELLIQKGKLVAQKEFLRLQEIGKKFVQRKVFSKIFATVLFVFIAYLIFAHYLFIFEKAVFFNLNSLLLVHTAIFLTLLLERFVFFMPSDFIYFALPASLAGLLLAILVRSRVALVGSLVVAILTALMSAFRADIILFCILGSFAGIYATVGLRKRSQFLKVGALVGIVNFIVIFSYWLLNDVSFRASFHLGTLGLANGFFMSVLVFFLIFFFEKAFQVTTDITLLELSDLNHPLLKRMVLEAPGTYHHTLMIANLCEAATEAIGANALLARVGCYFHDIGKIEESDFFTENESVQMIERGGTYQSPHEKMTPDTSTQMILNHVKEGIEVGKKNGLPKIILDFIPEHHGTCLVYYFYKKAMKQRKPEDPALNEEAFRYPGPKPQSKETAIALLADSVEASTRSLTDYSTTSLRANVRKIINEKFADGQLEECPLTFKDLEAIADSFVRTLTGVYHTRIKYPEKDEKKEAAKPLSD